MKEAVYVHQDRVAINVPADAGWHQMDLTPYLDNSAECVGVGLIGFKNVTSGATHYWGIDQDSWTTPAWLIPIHSRGISHAIVGLDANKKVWLYRSNSNVEIYLAVEFLSPGAVFYDAPIDHSPRVAAECNVWRNIICADGSLHGGDEASNVEAALVQAKTILAAAGQWNTRSYGSSLTKTFRTDIDWAAHWYAQNTISVEYGGVEYAIYDQYSSAIVIGKGFDLHQNVYEMGYLREPERSGYHAHFDPVEQTVSATGAWMSIQCGTDVIGGASAILARLENSENIEYIASGLRAIGSADPYSDIERGNNHLVSVAANLDDGKNYEYYASSLDLRIWRLGYSRKWQIGEVEASLKSEPAACADTSGEPSCSASLEMEASAMGRFEAKPAVTAGFEGTVSTVLGELV